MEKSSCGVLMGGFSELERFDRMAHLVMTQVALETGRREDVEAIG